jgi:hypothetical protein
MAESSPPVTVYVFRGFSTDTVDDTVVCAAPVDSVTSVFGGGGDFDTNGLSSAFGGCAYFRNAETGAALLAVWGARKASKFRALLRRYGMKIQIVKARPDAVMIVRITR